MNIESLRTVLSISCEIKTTRREFKSSKDKKETYDILELSNSDTVKAKERMSDSLLDLFNFDFVNQGNNTMTVTNNSIIIDGIEYSRQMIPSVSMDKCIPIKAVNNVVEVREGNYYQFKDINGKPHKLACAQGSFGNPYSEFIRGDFDEESRKLGFFWKLLSGRGIFNGLHFTREEMNYYLEQAGVQKGFFTVKVGEKQQDYLYTDVRSGRPGIIPRSQYDSDYKGITGQAGEIGTYYDYKAGAIVIIDGEEYTVSERGTLDIPYGINIYDVKEPPKSELKEQYQ